MSIESCQHWLQMIKSDPWYESQMPITEKSIDRALGFNAFYNPHRGVSKNGWKSLEALIPKIENREVIFMPKHEVILREPSGPWSVAKLTARWSLDNRCNCGCNKFLPVMIEKEYAACYSCIPPNQYPALGAKPIARSLIHDAMKNYYIAE